MNFFYRLKTYRLSYLLKYLFSEKITFAKWELNLFTFIVFVLGFSVGIIFLGSKIIPQIFATSQGSITQDTDTDFNASGTTLSSTVVSGSGTPAVVQLAGSGGPNGTQDTRTITIDNSTNSSALTNYQIRFTLDTQSLITAGKMRTDCGDIRILDSDNSTALSYWVESGCNTATTIIWVKVPSISASSTKSIYLYYNAPSITSLSNGNNVFLLFDDFSGSSIDGTKWTKVDPSSLITESGGKLNFTRGSGSGAWNTAFYSTSTFARSNISEEFSMNWLHQYTPYSAFMWGWNTTGSSYTNLTYGYYNQGSTNPYTASIYEDGSSRGSVVGSWATNTTYKVRVRMRSTGGAYYEMSTDNGATWTTSYTSTYSTASNLHMGWMLYSGDYQVWNAYVRNWTSPEPAITLGSEQATLQSAGTWESAGSGSNVLDMIWNGGWGDGTTGSSTAFSATVGSVSSSQTVAFQMRVASTTASLTSQSYVTLGTANSGTTFTVTKTQMDALGLLTGSNRYVQVKVSFAQSTGTTPTLDKFTIYYAQDNTAPSTNASSITMDTLSANGNSVASGAWNNSSTPYFSWVAGADSQSGIKGYCLYLGTDSAGDPATSKGLLGTSPISTSGTTCQFIVSATSIDFATSSYQGSPWLTSSTLPYYLNIKAIDNNNNIYATAGSFNFYYDGTSPSNTSYISCPGGNFSNVTDMSFTWPITGTGASSDAHSGLLGWQYQINSSTGTWQGTTHDTTLNLDYIPATASAYTLLQGRDGSSIVSGSNIVYFRTVDNAGNTSSGSTYRTCSLSYGGAAPTFPGNGLVTVTPATATTNSFALSWSTATASGSNTVAHYYYMINTSPPSTLATLQGNSTTYIDNGTATTVSAKSLANINKGTNTVYVVAIDNASTPNYSPSNYISGTFTLNSTNPDPVQSLVSTDSSIKAQSQWNVTLTWTAPSYQGAGNLVYGIYRSSDNVTFSEVGTTTGLSYVDNTPASQLYYYYVITKDGANATSANSATVTITPTGKYTSPPSLSSGPTVSSITTKTATITWSTDRNSDSKVSYGTSSGNYGSVDASNTTQVTSHSIILSNLTAGTTYYYEVKWTDSDGNTGVSTENNFTTTPAPSVSAVKATDISLFSAFITFTINNGTQAIIQYGTTTSYGGSVSTTTALGQNTYSVRLTNLTDGTNYHYRILMEDADGNQYYSDDYTDLVTLPRPRITNVRIQQVTGTAQPTVLISWSTNTQVSSVATYYPQGSPAQARDEVNVALIKGNHQILLQGLDPKTTYTLIVKGRDRVGNEAQSDSQSFTTATDTRPPELSSVQVEGSNVPTGNGQSQVGQLVVTWDTDKASTSQVEFGEGTGSTYAQKTQEDSNYTFNHLVIISNLSPSKVYHLRAVSKDKYDNVGYSIDTVTITPKATDNALNLVISNLQQAFGFLGGISK